MTRRNLFAALLAPLLAKFARKPIAKVGYSLSFRKPVVNALSVADIMRNAQEQLDIISSKYDPTLTLANVNQMLNCWNKAPL